MSTVVSDDRAQENIATNVTRLLQLRGWMQKDLAAATGENVMTISRVCRGTNMSGAGLIGRIAEALDVNIDRLIHDPPELATNKSRKTA